MGKVDFFIVGQPKSGTTALATFLDEHPEICIANPKEPGYMAKDLQKESDTHHGQKKFFHVRTPQQYQQTFHHATAQQIIGEASTNYLYSQAATKEIKRYNPNAKIIIMLRNPADMLHSLYHQYGNELGEDIATFQEALNAETNRGQSKNIPPTACAPSYLQYRQRGKYFKQIKRFYDTFEQKNILVLVSESFRKDNAHEFKKVLNFLGVENIKFQPNFRGVHDSKTPRSRTLLKLAHTPSLKTISRNTLGEQHYTHLQKKILEPLILKKSKRPIINPELRAELTNYFSKDIANTSKLIDIDLHTLWKIDKSAG